jgi:hypothetical protein
MPTTATAYESRDEQVHGVNDHVLACWHAYQAAELALADALRDWDQGGLWRADGAKSANGWLRSKCTIGHATASRTIALSRALTSFPEVAEAVRDHAISMEQARIMFNVFTPSRAEYAERDIDMLIANAAELNAADTRKALNYWAACVDAELAPDQHDSDGNGDGETAGGTVEEPSVLHIAELNDRTELHGSLNSLDSETLRTAIEIATRLSQGEPHTDTGTDHEHHETSEPAPESARADETVDPRTKAQQRADALTLIAAFFLDHHQTLGTTGGERPHINITVDLPTLRGDHGGLGFGSHTETGITADAVRMLCCDSKIARLITNGDSVVIDLGRLTRVIMPPLRKAVTFRDRHCRYCDTPARFCHVHHVRHWINGGLTNLDNCTLLCPFHHRLIHTGGWALTGDPNRELTITSPTGRTYISRPPPPLTLAATALQRKRRRVM